MWYAADRYVIREDRSENDQGTTIARWKIYMKLPDESLFVIFSGEQPLEDESSTPVGVEKIRFMLGDNTIPFEPYTPPTVS